MNVLDSVNLQQNLKAVYLLLQCCLSKIYTTSDDRDICTCIKYANILDMIYLKLNLLLQGFLLNVSPRMNDRDISGYVDI